MITEIEQLKQLVSNTKSFISYEKHIKAHYPNLYRYILDNTQFLISPRVNFTERVYCIINDINYVIINAFGEPALFNNMIHGYSLCEKTKSKNDAFLAKQKIKEIKSREYKEQLKKKHDELELQYKYYAHLVNKDLTFGKKIYDHIQSWINGYGKFLYTDDKKFGIDYIVCPITGLRKQIIRSNYYTKILGLTKEEYIEIVGQDFNMVAPGHVKAICDGLHVIVEDADGKTKHQLGIESAKNTLSTKDENGITGYKKIGQKTRKTHIDRIDDNGHNGYQRQVIGRLTTILDNGLTVEENAHQKRTETIAKEAALGNGKTRRASKLSKKILQPVLFYLDYMELKYYFDKSEYCIKDTINRMNYFYDLTIPELNIVIEFQSNAYHPDPRLSDIKWNNWRPVIGNYTAEEKLKSDYQKAKLAYDLRGFTMFFVWENSFEQEMEDILCYIQTQNMKY